MKSFADWLREIGLERYAAVMAQNAIDFDVVRTLSDDELRELGLALGDRKRLRQALVALPQDESSAQEPSSHEAQRRQLTVLFCDLVGSTALAQKLDPEELRDLMQAYQRACGKIIARYDGHVAQYLGDGLMVYFGWPRAHEDDAVRAIRAGLEVAQAVSKLIASPPIRARVGIHTGLVVVGETGQGDASIPRAAVGETPNIAARLQALAEPSSVVVSERTRLLAEGMFDYADLGSHALKGVSKPMRLFRVMCSRSTESRFEASRSELILTPLVGREEEIALLLRRWQQAKEGEGQVVLVGGEPGIGKSRLTRVLRERLGQERHLILRYQCSPYHLNSALYPAIEQLERAAGFTREDSADQKLDKMQAMLVGSEQQVAESAPFFAALLSLPTERYPLLDLSPQKQKEETLEALAGQVEALANQQPVLMIYEDVHWLDATSQEAMDLLVPRLRELPVLVIVTYRPEYSPRWTDQAHVTTLGLNRLGRRQGAELVAKLTGGKALPQEVLEQIVAHTDGVPLFIEELTKSVLESKLLRAEGVSYVLDGPLPALAIPTTLRDSLIARLDRLAPVRELAQIGACIGREFSYELLAALSPLKGERLEEALEQLTKTGLVFRRGTPPDASYTFKHALVQDVAYDSLLKSKRAQLHAQIAQVLEERFPDRTARQPEVLAHHFTEAQQVDRATGYWLKAGKQAAERSANLEAISQLSKGLEGLSALPESRERDQHELALQIAIGTPLIAVHGYAAPQTGAAYSRARVLCERLGEPQALLATLSGEFTYHFTRGDYGMMRQLAEEASQTSERMADQTLRLAAHRLSAITAMHLGAFPRARSEFEMILRRYDPSRHRPPPVHYVHDPKVSALTYLALILWMLGYPDQARRSSIAAFDYARLLNQANLTAHVSAYAGAGLDELVCNTVAVRMHADAIIELADRHSLHYWRLSGLILRGWVMAQEGASDEGLALMRQSLTNRRALGVGWYQIRYLCMLATIHLRYGPPEAGLRIIAEAKDLLARNDEHMWEAELKRLEGELRRMQGVPVAEIEGCLEQALTMARSQSAKSVELRAASSLARLWRDQGKLSEARDLLRPLYGWFTEGFDTKDLKEAKALLEELG